MQLINSAQLPVSKGHYSHAVAHNGVLYISGQLPIDPSKNEIPDGIAAQTLVCLKRIEAILAEVGSTKYDILQVRIYVADVELWGKVNEQYRIFFEAHKPARCVVPTNRLHYGSLIEIEAVAVVR